MPTDWEWANDHHTAASLYIPGRHFDNIDLDMIHHYSRELVVSLLNQFLRATVLATQRGSWAAVVPQQAGVHYSKAVQATVPVLLPAQFVRETGTAH